MNEAARETVCIADVVFRIDYDHSEFSLTSNREMQLFSTHGKPDVTIQQNSAAIPYSLVKDAELIFASGDMWSVRQGQSTTMLTLMTPNFTSDIERLMVFDLDFHRGEFFMRHARPRKRRPDPLEYPLGQVLMVSLLSRGRGLMFHALGIEHRGNGYLFAGNSGHGKSTLGGLWRDKARILNDDRVIVRFVDGQFWLYPTPWHGTLPDLSVARAPLTKIFVLSRGQENHSRPLTQAEAICFLLQRAFPPLWSRDGMAFTMDFLAQLVPAVPCYELAFVPQESVVDFIQCMK
ncbi:MAG: hypothetical protein AB1733_05490 [Thermodesulfobacteriota bacterium]